MKLLSTPENAPKRRKRWSTSQTSATARPKRAKTTSASRELSLLCNSCQQLDLEKACRDAGEYFASNWDLILSLRAWKDAFSKFDGRMIGTIKLHPQSETSGTCPLCKLFYNFKLGHSPDDNYAIKAFPEYWVLPFIRLSASTIGIKDRNAQPCVLVVLPAEMRSPALSDQFNISNSLFVNSSMSTPLIYPRQVGRDADLKEAMSWISFCDSNHGPDCPKQGAGSGYSKQVPGFRLIDCNSRKTVKSSLRRSYVALSYVWGGSQIQSSGFPQVVEDALQVTKKLGYKYLWVDQYCIDQTNLKEKMQQISNMNLIYQCAQLSIIAAAGTNAADGLSGVSRGRTVASSVKIGETELTMVPTDAHESIKRSRWWDRGWTYQEGVLSRRRLYFTDDQIYYECGGMVCYESFGFSENLLHNSSLTYQPRYLRGSIFSSTLENDDISFLADNSDLSRHRAARMLSHLEKYSRRNLSYNTDSLNAFKGILAGNQASSVFGLLGLHPTIYWAGVNNQYKNELAKALVGWWHLKPGATRVPEFPSWTWAGWRGPIKTQSEPNTAELSLQWNDDNLNGAYGPALYLKPRKDEDAKVKEWWFDFETPKVVQMIYGKQLHLDREDIEIRMATTTTTEGATTFDLFKSGRRSVSLHVNLSVQVAPGNLMSHLKADFAMILMARNSEFFYFLVLQRTQSEDLPSWTKTLRTWTDWSVWERIGVCYADILSLKRILNTSGNDSIFEKAENFIIL